MEIESKGGGDEAGKTHIDTFGQEREPDGKPVVPPAPAAPAEKKEGDAPKPEDIESNPVVVALKDQIKKLEDDKSSMGGNLSAQGEALTKLKKELDGIKKGDKPSVEPLFKDIKRVKDLSQEQQDAMSDAEKKLFDDLADTRDAMNKQVADAAKKEGDAAEAAKTEEDEAATAEAFNTKVQGAALALVGSADGRPTQAQKDLANAIIEEFNAFADNDKLTPQQLKERLEKAAKLVPDYKPAKEQKSPAGGAAKPVEAAGGDASIDKIIQETQQGKTGGTYSL